MGCLWGAAFGVYRGGSRWCLLRGRWGVDDDDYDRMDEAVQSILV